MEFIFVRHAKALDKLKAQKQKVPDEKRPLTKKGSKKFAEQAENYKKSLAGAGLYVESPLLRSKETLDIILQIIPEKKYKRLVLDKIKPEDDPKLFLNWLLKRKEKKLVAVSHEPFMSEFIKLVSGRKILIKKGNIIVLQLKKKKFHLLEIY